MIRMLLLSLSIGALACKSDDKPKPTPPPVVVDNTGSGTTGSGPMGSGTTAGADAAGGFPLAAGETYAGGKVMATNLDEWKVEDGSIVQLGIITTGKNANGREDGVLRAYHVGSETHDVGPKYSLDPTVDHWSELKVLPNNRVMFRYGEAGKGARARNAVILTWDASAKRVRIAKRWTGATTEEEPSWLLTGEYKVAPESEALCIKVIARMVSCEKDPKFRDAIFRRDDAKEKAAMQAHFDTHVAKWKRAGEAKAQCQTWASAEYADTHFSEPAKLKRLAAEVKHDCGFFASEIVDEGGLPTALTDA
ncbi:MAG: hypothetical protein M4D80_12765 [Myxococcota bacterium]|nr:hypothetical protein [Myxococcota bacterium]